MKPGTDGGTSASRPTTPSPCCAVDRVRLICHYVAKEAQRAPAQLQWIFFVFPRRRPPASRSQMSPSLKMAPEASIAPVKAAVSPAQRRGLQRPNQAASRCAKFLVPVRDAMISFVAAPKPIALPWSESSKGSKQQGDDCRSATIANSNSCPHPLALGPLQIAGTAGGSCRVFFETELPHCGILDRAQETANSSRATVFGASSSLAQEETRMSSTAGMFHRCAGIPLSPSNTLN